MFETGNNAVLVDVDVIVKLATGVSKSAITKLTVGGVALAQSNWFEIEEIVGNALTVTVKIVDWPQ